MSRDSVSSQRPIARLVVCLAILLLGGVAAYRLELGYLPSLSFPELTVRIQVADALEVDDLTRLYIQPLELAIRAIGDVTSMAGEVDSSGGYLQVRFRAGTNAERKAARLESELVALRRRLPPNSNLAVWPAGQGGGESSIFLWIDQSQGKTVGHSFIEAVRALPEVRDVRVAGGDRQELRLTATGVASSADIQRAVGAHLAVRRLGEVTTDGRRRSMLARGAPDTPLRDLVVRSGEALLSLSALTEMEIADQEAAQFVHLDGQRGLVLLISRELEASPLALERALRRTLERFDLGEGGWRFIRNEAAPLKELLKRLTLGLLAAILVTAALAGLLGGPLAAASQALALPVALAAALNAFWLAGLSLDVTTLPMLAVALGWCLFFPALRSGTTTATATMTVAATMMAAAVLLPIAVSLASGRLASLFQTPTRAFLCAQLAGIAALAILPLPPVRDPFLGLGRWAWVRPAWVGRPLRAALRNPWTVLLTTVTGTYALLVLFGDSLAPRPGNLSPVTSDLRVVPRFAEGTTPKQAQSQVALIEKELTRHPEVVGHWSHFDRHFAVLYASVRSSDRSPRGLRALADRLQINHSAQGFAVKVEALTSGAGRNSKPVRFNDSLETRAESDSDASFYRFVLRGTDLESLRTVHTQIIDRLIQYRRVGRQHIRTDWRSPGTRLELVPRPGVSPAEIRAGAAFLNRRSSLPPSRDLPSMAEIDLRVSDRDAPQTSEDVRPRADILGLSPAGEGTTTVPGALFEVRQVVSSPGVQRQAGRYVLPVTVRFFTLLKRFEDRENIDRILRWMAVPPDCDLELPRLSADLFSADRRRMLGIAATLPLLIWALAVIRLNSPRRGLVALAPLLISVAATTPWIRAAKGHVDEMMLFALGAMAVGGAPLAIHTLASTRSARAGGPEGRGYRWLVSHALVFLVAAVGMTLLLAVPGLGVDVDHHPWVLPLRLAAVAGVFSCLGSLFCLPGLLRSASHWRQRKARRTRRRAMREAWRAPGELVLETRHLAKVYGNGFQALRGVDFRLEPGIIGLLGPNGAGKTTLLRTLCGLLEPSRGKVLYRGVPITAENLAEYRGLVGFLPQDFNAYPGFTGAQFLDYWALEKGLLDPRERRDEVERWLAQVGLEDAAGRKVRDFSGGMRRRIGIARALLGDPPIVIVDEPTTGLDVSSRNRLRESLLRVAGERIILFSTHIASDVAAAAARILLLHNGALLYDGSAIGMIEQARGSVFETMVNDQELREFSHRYRVTTRVRTLDGIRVRAVISGESEPPGQVVEPNLEEAYLAMIGGQGWKREKGRLTGSLLDLESWRQVA